MSFSRRASFGKVAIGLVAWSFVAASEDIAAQSGQVDRAQLSRDQTITTAPPLSTSNGEQAVVSSPNDPDLGEQAILRRNDNYQPFVASVSVPIYWTSNVA